MTAAPAARDTSRHRSRSVVEEPSPGATDELDLLARASIWQWAARAFAYPDAAMAAAVLPLPWQGRVDRKRLPGSLAPALDGVEAAVGQLNHAPWSLAEEHTMLFCRSVPAPPHGTSYGPGLGFERTQDMAKVGSLYKAFGLQVAAAHPELPDHVCAELEFVAVLLAKEAYARAQRSTAQAARSVQVRSLFLREHLTPWFPRFAQRLAQHHRLDFYPAVAALVLALLAAEGVPVAAPESTSEEDPASLRLEDEADLMGACETPQAEDEAELIGPCPPGG